MVSKSPPIPRLGVSAGIWRGNEVLLVRRGGETFGGLWSFPGGHVEWGEALADAVRREALEETGLRIVLKGEPLHHEIILRDAAGTVSRHYVLMVFAATTAANAEPAFASDALDARFVSVEDAAKMPLTTGLDRFIQLTRQMVRP
ncbi:NUDIX hydrolase [Oryzibacter oryziterrae]|uniref:NUDIX hydrolase n=1 Tax=Oryzibacter oryziterrae TaxID=2766474 RepID=UPI001F247A08|nr:NUDIX hydrolase [Oryzibacter oryziterrae]